MSTSAIGSSTSVEPLIRKLVERLDRNQDGQITTAEFGDFLTSLVEAHRATTGPGGAARSPLTSALSVLGLSDKPEGPVSEAPTADVDAFHPSTWTDNNAPYGVTFAGWSPQDHTDLTLEDLGKPGKAEKYAVYHYLVTNRIQPTSDWAPAVAAALNEKYNTTVYRAIDGETLGYGNQYVHSAPNGYGMAPGTFNPAATGEFFWGWV